MIKRDEMLKVANTMMESGGGFVKKLGEALIQADSDNVQKIKDTWPELWQKYLEW